MKYFLSFCLLFSIDFLYAQSVITSSTTRDTHLVEVENKTSVELSKVVGNNVVNLDFLIIDGRNNIIEDNTKAIIPEMTAVDLNPDEFIGKYSYCNDDYYEIYTISKSAGKYFFQTTFSHKSFDIKQPVEFVNKKAYYQGYVVSSDFMWDIRLMINDEGKKVIDVMCNLWDGNRRQLEKEENVLNLREITGVYSNDHKHGYIINYDGTNLYMSFVSGSDKKYILQKNTSSFSDKKYDYVAASYDFGIPNYIGYIYFDFGEQLCHKVLYVLYGYRDYQKEVLKKVD